MSEAFSGPDYPALDIQDRSTTLSLPTTPTVFKPATIAAQNIIGYDQSTGIITLPETRVYHTFLVANANVTGVQTVYAYVSVNTGSGFGNSTYSGRQLNFNGNTDGQLSTTSADLFQAGHSSFSTSGARLEPPWPRRPYPASRPPSTHPPCA